MTTDERFELESELLSPLSLFLEAPLPRVFPAPERASLPAAANTAELLPAVYGKRQLSDIAAAPLSARAVPAGAAPQAVRAVPSLPDGAPVMPYEQSASISEDALIDAVERRLTRRIFGSASIIS